MEDNVTSDDDKSRNTFFKSSPMCSWERAYKSNWRL